MKDLKDKIIAITGGATGMGVALAKAFGSEGAKIVIGETREEKLQEAIDRFKNLNIDADKTHLDVTDLKSVEKFADFTCERYGRVDMLINNAGISGARGRIDKVDIEEAKKVFDVNFFGVWNGCSVFSKKMIDQGTNAAIYNLGSENSLFVAVPNSVGFVGSKDAVLGIS